MSYLDDALLAKKAEDGQIFFLADLFTPQLAKNRKEKAMKQGAEELSKATTEIRDAERVLKGAIDSLLQAEKDISEKSKAAISRAKDSANQLSDQLLRVSKILGSDFESRLQQLERMTDSLVRLEELAKNGSLQTVLKALE